MALITQSIKNFISGISQQPDILRYPEQLEAQINGFSTEAGGLQKRPPTLHLATLDLTTSAVKPKVHFINRDSSEQYAVIFTGTDIVVYDILTGERKAVTYEGNAKTYIQHNTPRSHLKVVTIADYTFIVNQSIMTKMSTAKSANTWNSQGLLVNVKSGQYGRTYKIVVNGEAVASFTTPDGKETSHVTQINTDYIVDQLASQAATKGYTITKGSSWLCLSGKTINTAEVYDGYNNQAMVYTLKTTQKFTNLPASAPNGFVVKITGEKNSRSDDYYVKYDSTEGLWKETLCPNIPYKFDLATMPHTLIRQADGSFLCRQGEWTDRMTGDEDSNPLPSFIDYPINDIFFFRNRLGFLSGENIILSSNSDFFNFWVASATTIQDTDAIDVAVSNNKVSTLYQAVPHGEDLIIFSGDTQFSLRAEGVLSPTNVKADTLTYFSSETNVKPVGVGRNIYFSARRTDYSSIKEYFTAFDNTDKRDAQDITSHVPNYIPNGIYQIVPSTIDNIILFLTEGDPEKLYVYKFLFLEGIKQQSAWSVWDFKGEIIGASFIDSALYLIIKRGDKYCLEKLIVSHNTKDFDSEPYRVYADRKVETGLIPESNFDRLYNLTYISLKDYYDPSTLKEGETYIVMTPYGVIYLTDALDTLQMVGDYSGQKLIIGRLFTFQATLSTFMVHKKDEEGKNVSFSDGRLQIQHGWLNYEETGYFKVQVKTPTDERNYTQTLYTFNSGDRLGNISLKSGVFKYPVQKQNDKVRVNIISDLPTPIAFVGGGWNGRYTRRHNIV